MALQISLKFIMEEEENASCFNFCTRSPFPIDTYFIVFFSTVLETKLDEAKFFILYLIKCPGLRQPFTPSAKACGRWSTHPRKESYHSMSKVKATPPTDRTLDWMNRTQIKCRCCEFFSAFLLVSLHAVHLHS